MREYALWIMAWISLYPLHYGISHFHYTYCHKHIWMHVLLGDSRMCVGLSAAKQALVTLGIGTINTIPFRKWLATCFQMQ